MFTVFFTEVDRTGFLLSSFFGSSFLGSSFLASYCLFTLGLLLGGALLGGITATVCFCGGFGICLGGFYYFLMFFAELIF